MHYLSCKMKIQETPFDVLIDTYLGSDIGIDFGFLDETLTSGLYDNIIKIKKNELLIPAGIGNGDERDQEQKMRSDTIYWLDKSHGNVYEQEFLQLVEDFIAHLNMTCYTGINEYEFHYAVYEQGSFYKRHKDQFKNNNSRKYSLISYLNQDWLEQDGGQLLIYQNDTVQKILPLAQTGVFFKSDEMEHEVTKSNRCRLSISGWLKQV